MMHSIPLLASVLLMISCQSSPRRVPGSLDHPFSGRMSPAAQDVGDAEAAERPNHIGLFLGATHKQSDDGFSIGIEYERDVSELIGLGVVVESTPSLNERVIAAPAAFLHPIGALEVALAPGLQVEDGDTDFMFRIGVGWEFDVGQGFSLAPEVNFDFVSGNDNALVYGLALGYAF